MKSFYEVQQLLKRFGTLVYVGDRQSDALLMEEEVRELYQNQLITIEEYRDAILILQKEKKT
ncbi:YqgQ family protein [Alkalibacillus aidingensis]|uniref:YqgQ family protein n=1 Tax=Alkalibacillus aidingensis TaxID=2747607 RepID=UPI0016601076|nr:YqgQ family protein [Alkalibacillus aidingensis]